MPRLTLVPLPGHPLLELEVPRGVTVPGAVDGGPQLVFDVEAGTPILDAAQSAGVPIATLCGGAMACQTCHVLVALGTPASALSPRGRKETELLEALGLPAHARFGCQAKVLGDVVVEIPDPSASLSASDFELPS